MIIILVFLLAAALLTGICYKRKKGHYKLRWDSHHPQITWEENALHDTEISNGYEFSHEIYTKFPTETISTNKLDENVVQGADNNTMETLALPKWLRDQSEMIFPPRCIEKEQKLGHGQYGTVFKGKLVLGKSVYVNSMLQ